MAVSKKLTLDEQYQALLVQGPAEFLKEKGADGKRLARCAFDGTFQPFGPFDASIDDDLRAVLQALLEYARQAYEAKFEGVYSELLVSTARQTVRGLHTHSGKYVHAEAGTQLVSPAGEEKSPYLSSGSACGMRATTAGFAHAPKHSAPAKLFLAHVRIGGRILAVAELLSQDHPVVRAEFLAAGVCESDYAAIQAAFARAYGKQLSLVDKFLPQLLWPLPEGDMAVTPVPALAVYNAISAMKRGVGEEQFLPSSDYLVGSGQAQNISVAASSLAGHFPLLLCVPPRGQTTEAGALVRRMHARRLMAPVPREVLKKFDIDIHPWPNAQRHRFLERAAKKHVSIALALALELRERVHEGECDRDSLPAGGTPLGEFIRGAALSAEARESLRDQVLEQGPAGVMHRHAAEDTLYYRAAMLRAIEALEA